VAAVLVHSVGTSLMAEQAAATSTTPAESWSAVHGAVVAEGLNSLFDMFSEEDKDHVFAQLALLPKLRSFSPLLRNKVRDPVVLTTRNPHAPPSMAQLTMVRVVCRSDRRVERWIGTCWSGCERRSSTWIDSFSTRPSTSSDCLQTPLFVFSIPPTPNKQ
jgi:hypothetical protein